MPRKTTNPKIKSQGHKNTGHNKQHDSIETVPDISSIKRESNSEDKEIKRPCLNRRRNKQELESSPTRCSSRIQAQKSRLVPKYSLPLIDSPPLPVPRELIPITTLPPLSRPVSKPSLSISTRESQYSQNRSTSEPAPSHHTVFSSPINTSQDSAESVMDTHEDSNASENERLVNQREIPSSIPVENHSDGIGDAWPSSQSDSSPTKRSYSKSSQRSQPRYEDGFRVPDPPSSRMSLDSTQDETQASLGISPPKAHRQPSRNSPFRRYDRLNWTHPGLADTQDESQSDTHAPQSSPPAEHNAFRILRTSSFPKINIDDTQDLTQDESESEIPNTERKRKREPTINEIPDSVPLNNTFQSPKPTALTLDDSCVILSPGPRSMRKKTPEIINIHSTQSQSQEWIPAPGPRATSQDLSKPFGRNDSGDSSVSSTSQPFHKWESSQATQSPSRVELSSFVNPPSQPLLSSQNDWSRIPVPLALTLEYGFPQKPLDLPDLNKRETELDLNLQKWEEEKYRPKSKHK